MRVSVVKIGNSRGVRIPKPMLEQVGISKTAEMTVEAGRLVIEPVRPAPREGWAEALDKAFATGDEDTESFEDLQAVSNAFDETEWTWPEPDEPVAPTGKKR